MKYIPYLDIANHLGIQPGDRICLASDIKLLMLGCVRNNEVFDPALFIRSLTDLLGSEGTLLLHTFTWDFCKGKPFDCRYTPGAVGSLGNVALGMEGFRRTQHPLYSFAVHGKDSFFLCGLENKDSFGIGTPFQYLYDADAKFLTIGVTWNVCYTYLHHIEQISGYCPYRYHKDFTGLYTDEKGETTLRTYSMFVRRLELGLVPDPVKYRRIIESSCTSVTGKINETFFNLIDFRRPTQITLEEIKRNGYENIVSKQEPTGVPKQLE